VYSYVSSSVGEMGLLINLQSERDSVYLENRVEAFLIRAQVNKYTYIFLLKKKISCKQFN
jgi:hypothetical protein